MTKDLQIYVLCGGFSGEREVSLRSGANVHAALQRLGYKQAKLFEIKDTSSITEISKLKIDLAIPMTHGTYGEDGCLQGLLELLKIPYSGSKVLASAIGMNKIKTKAILKSASLPVLASAELNEFISGTANAELVLKQGQINGFIAKPICDGSSVGIERLKDAASLKTFAQNNKDKNYFVEPFIKGVEVTTSIIPSTKIPNATNCLTDKDLSSLPILELRPKKEFYDYEAKYTAGMTEFVLPAAISAELASTVHNYALAAYRAVGCSGFARTDFIIAGGIEPYILEVNTLPGMTDTSDLPAQAAAAGISYDELVELLVQSSITKAIAQV